MRTFLTLPRAFRRPLPSSFAGEDVRYSESLVEYFVEEFTQPGDFVLDPFAGFGTTLEVAERMGRAAHGVELVESRVHYARENLEHPERLHLGDSRHIRDLALPRFHLSLTSPPYMPRSDHPENPLSAYQEDGAGYLRYLADLRGIYQQVRNLLHPGATVVLEVSNIKGEKEVTPLAWDIAEELSKELRFAGEIAVGWDEPCFGYDHSYCLVFKHDRRLDIAGQLDERETSAAAVLNGEGTPRSPLSMPIGEENHESGIGHPEPSRLLPLWQRQLRGCRRTPTS